MKAALKQQIKTRKFLLKDLNIQYERYTALSKTSLHVIGVEDLKKFRNILDQRIQFLEEQNNGKRT